MKTGRRSKLVKSRVYRHLGGNIIGGDRKGFERDCAKWLKKKFGIKTVLDVGCGEGHMVRYFHQLGCQAIGLDGLPRNAEVSKTPVIVLDLTKGSIRIDKIDLVWCVEVVEHIDKKHIRNLLAVLGNGEYVAMTFADIGKGGYHHVNEQHESYWVAQMEAIGYKHLVNESHTLRGHGHGYMDKSGLLFHRRSGKWRT